MGGKFWVQTAPVNPSDESQTGFIWGPVHVEVLEKERIQELADVERVARLGAPKFWGKFGSPFFFNEKHRVLQSCVLKGGI